MKLDLRILCLVALHQTHDIIEEIRKLVRPIRFTNIHNDFGNFIAHIRWDYLWICVGDE